MMNPVAARATPGPTAPRGRWFLFVLLAGVLSATSGCALFVKEPRVTIADVEVVSLGLLGGSARVALLIDNPNRFDLEVRSFAYRLEVANGAPGGEESWISLANQDELVRQVLIRGREQVEVEVPVAFGYAALGSAVRALLVDGQVRYRVQGSVRVRGPVGEHNLPFTGRGVLGS
jgi:LEA14-like dessication related protein